MYFYIDWTMLWTGFQRLWYARANDVIPSITVGGGVNTDVRVDAVINFVEKGGGGGGEEVVLVFQVSEYRPFLSVSFNRIM